MRSFIISRVLRILASQSRFQSLYDEIFNIGRWSSNPFLSEKNYGLFLIVFLNARIVIFCLNIGVSNRVGRWGVEIEQGRKRPLDTSKRMIERRERVGEREKGRRRERERKVEGEI